MSTPTPGEPRPPGPDGGAARGERTVPYHCPFCAEQDLHPHPAATGAWHCRACLRTFTVHFLGMAPIERPPRPLTDPDAADPFGAS